MLHGKVAFALEHDRLAVAAHVGDQLDAAQSIAHQGAALIFMGQGVIVARMGHRQLVAHIAGTLPKERVQFALKQRFIEIS